MIPWAQELSTWIGVGGWGQFISSRVTQSGQASWALWKHALASASVAEERTLGMMMLTMWTAPFNFGFGEFVGVEGKELRKKMPPARDHALDSDKYKETLKDYIIQLVQKSFRNGKDVTDSIRKMDRIDMTSKIPIRRISGTTNADERVTEQEGYDILYKAEIDMYTKRKHKLEDNMNKTYSLIYRQHCSKTIQDRIHAHPDFETKIKNDPIELLKAIEILINNPVQTGGTKRISHRSDDKIYDMQTARERAIGRLCEEVQELSRQHGTKHGKGFPKGICEEHKTVCR
jgi:hypothetical protein